MNTTYSATEETRQFNEQIKEYIQTVLEQNPSEEEQQVYRCVLAIFQKYEAADNVKPPNIRERKDSASASSLVETKPLIQIEQQKTLCYKLLNRIQDLFTKLSVSVHFNTMGCLSLQNVIEIIILKCFLNAFLTGLNKENHPEQAMFFFNSLHPILLGKEWTSKNLEPLFLHFIKQLNLSLQTEDLANLTAILRSIELLSRQKECLSLPLATFEELPSEMEQQDRMKSIRFVIEIQRELFALLNPVIKSISKTMTTLKKDSTSADLQKLDMDQGLKSNSRQLNKQLIGQLNYFLKYCKFGNSDCIRICNTILDPTEHEGEIVWSINPLLAQSRKKENKIRASLLSLEHFIREQQEGFEISLPRIERHEAAQKNFKIYYALTTLKRVVYFDQLAAIIRSFAVKFPQFSLAAYELNKGANGSNLFQFLEDRAKLENRLYKNPKNREQDALRIKKLIEKTKQHAPEWFKAFIDHLNEELGKTYQHLLTYHQAITHDRNRRFPFIKLDAKTVKKTFAVTLEIFAEMHHLQVKANTVRNSEELTARIKKTNFLVKNFLEELCIILVTAGIEHYRIIHQSNDYRKWQEEKEVQLENLLKSENKLFKICLQGSLEVLNEAQTRLQNFHPCLDIGFDFLTPALQKLRDTFPDKSDTTTSWLLTIDGNSWKKRKRQNKTSRSHFTKKSEQKIKGEKEPAEEKEPPLPMSPPPLIFSREKVIVPPHILCKSKEISQEELFYRDRVYHQAHLLWTLDLLHQSILDQNGAQVSLLGADVLNFFYHLHEQTLTPLYLNLTNKMRHGLMKMSQALNVNCSPINENGSQWFRYPHARADFYTSRGDSLPLGMELLLTFSKAQKENAHGSLTTIPTLLKLIRGNVENLKELKQFYPDAELEIGIQKLQEGLLKLNSVDSLLPAAPPSAILLGQENENRLELRKLEEKLQTHAMLETNSNPQFQILVNDLLFHMRRLGTALSLSEKHPQQQFLSLHEHHFRMCFQYMFEVSFSLISHMAGDEIHTHNFMTYWSLLHLETIIPREKVKSFKEKFNVGKGVDYLYWEFYRTSQHKSLSGLKCLSEAFEISFAATEMEEGFIPSAFNEQSLIKKRGNLQNFVSEGLEILKLVAEERILKLSE